MTYLCIVNKHVCAEILISSCRYIEEAFAMKNMPDLGHEVKDFTVFSWRLSNWRKLEKKLTSPEFECGGHRWYVDIVYSEFTPHYVLIHTLYEGEYFYSHLATLMHHRTTLSPFISTMRTQRELPKVGTLVPNSRWSSRIPMTLPFTLSLVRPFVNDSGYRVSFQATS